MSRAVFSEVDTVRYSGETGEVEPPENSPRGRSVRARVRAEMTAEILAAARRQLAEAGAAALSLRAVARKLQMAPSALYRYFPSRDELLTALILEGYDSLGEQVETAERVCARDDLFGRFEAACHAVRRFALAHPHEYALLYGSPVPGYEAPPDTVPAASRVPVVLAGILADGALLGRLARREGAAPALPGPTAEELRRLTAEVLAGIDPELAARGILVWVELFGLVSFELYGHLVGSVDDYDAFFAWSVRTMALFVGLVERPPTG